MRALAQRSAFDADVCVAIRYLMHTSSPNARGRLSCLERAKAIANGTMNVREKMDQWRVDADGLENRPAPVGVVQTCISQRPKVELSKIAFDGSEANYQRRLRRRRL